MLAITNVLDFSNNLKKLFAIFDNCDKVMA